MAQEYEYLGDLSAVEPWHVRHMECSDCMVSWGGCWDNFQCPKCGEGELPSYSDSIELGPLPEAKK